jgi:hypothetical protein
MLRAFKSGEALKIHNLLELARKQNRKSGKVEWRQGRCRRAIADDKS